MMKPVIVLDAMGTDDRPAPELEASVLATKAWDIEVILVGDETVLRAGLAKVGGNQQRIRIVHAPQVIEMTDHVVETRAKKENTMAVGFNLVKDGEAQAFVTAGNTGMAMYLGTKTFGMIPGVTRPCLVGTFPVKDGKCVLLDLGANADVRPEFLVQFGQMGAVYARVMHRKSSPRVGLLSNGEEEGKGNQLVIAAGPLMRESVPGFVGNIEGKELFAGVVDVAVTDGFTGNILLKSVEAVATLIMTTLKDEIMSSPLTLVGGQLAKPALRRVKQLLDPSEIGAAPLLGLNGLAFVGHGRSDARAMVNAIDQARIAIESNMLGALRSAIK